MITVDGKQVKVGDTVCFKCDVEQCGTILSFAKSMRGITLTLGKKSGFSGEYIGGQTVTTEDAASCWID